MTKTDITDKPRVRLFSSTIPGQLGEPVSAIDQGIRGWSHYKPRLIGDSKSAYYWPHLDKVRLGLLPRANPHHASAISFKRNVLLKTLRPSSVLSYQDALQAINDYFSFGECYFF